MLFWLPGWPADPAGQNCPGPRTEAAASDTHSAQHNMTGEHYSAAAKAGIISAISLHQDYQTVVV